MIFEVQSANCLNLQVNASRLRSVFAGIMNTTQFRSLTMENAWADCLIRGIRRNSDWLPEVVGIVRGLYGPSGPPAYIAEQVS